MSGIGPDLFRRLYAAREYLGDNCCERITLARAAEEAFLSPFHFHRLYRGAFGETPHRYLSRLRMDRAIDLLRTTGLTVSEICLEVGFDSLGTFSKRFAEQHGYPPTQFRRIFAAPDIWALKIVPACYWRGVASQNGPTIAEKARNGDSPNLSL